MWITQTIPKDSEFVQVLRWLTIYTKFILVGQYPKMMMSQEPIAQYSVSDI